MDLFEPVQRMKELRYYQTEANEAIEKAIAEGERPLVIMATGTGKTIIAAEWVRRTLLRKEKTLMLAHREELVDQAIDKLSGHSGYAPDKEMAQHWADLGANVVVGSVPTMQRKRLERFRKDAFQHMIIDEAHHSISATYRNIINHFDKSSLLGITATADRADDKQLGNIYTKVAYEYPLHKAINDGFLVKIVGRRCNDFTINLSKLKITAGDFQDDELAGAIAEYITPIAENVRKQTEGKQTLCFLPNVYSSKLMAEELCKLGVKAGYISGATDKELRRHTLYEFKQGIITHLCSCNVLLEGYDEPKVSAIVMLRPTGSRTVYAQAIGRGTRLHPGKKELLLVEFTYNSDKLRLVTAYELFSTMGFGDNVQKRAQKTAEGSEEEDFMENLEKAHEKEYNPIEIVRRMTIPQWGFTAFDPLEVGKLINVDLSGEFDIHYEGRKLEGAATEKQKEILKRYGINSESLSKAQASVLISEFFKRGVSPMIGIATEAQLRLLARLGYTSPGDLMKGQAAFLINELKGAKERSAI